MTEIERKALVPEGQTPLNKDLSHLYLDVIRQGEKARDDGTQSPYHGHSLEHCLHAQGWVQRDLRLALDSAVEQHEAFRRVVSDAASLAKHLISEWVGSTREDGERAADYLTRFIIIPKPVDPLVEALCEMDPDTMPNEADAHNLRAALAARGLKIVEAGGMTGAMTEPSEAAMKVWREARYAWRTGRNIVRTDEGLQIGDNEAAALVIDRAMVAGEPVAAPDTAALVSALEAMNRHLEAMQCQCAQYLEHSGYTAFDRKSIAFENEQEAQTEMFVSDMIYLLDGPEQREAQGKARALLAQHKGTEHG